MAASSSGLEALLYFLPIQNYSNAAFRNVILSCISSVIILTDIWGRETEEAKVQTNTASPSFGKSKLKSWKKN